MDSCTTRQKTKFPPLEDFTAFANAHPLTINADVMTHHIFPRLDYVDRRFVEKVCKHWRTWEGISTSPYTTSTLSMRWGSGFWKISSTATTTTSKHGWKKIWLPTLMASTGSSRKTEGGKQCFFSFPFCIHWVLAWTILFYFLFFARVIVLQFLMKFTLYITSCSIPNLFPNAYKIHNILKWTSTTKKL